MDAEQPTRMTRRTWAWATLAGGLTASRAINALAPTDLSDSWIDAHVHVWTPDVARYPLDPRYTVADMQPPSFTPEELLSHCQPVGVQRIVLIQMSFYGYDNRYMLDVIKQHPGRFAGVGIVDHHAPDVAGAMAALADGGVRGFRLHPQKGEAAGWPADEGMGRLWKTARANGWAACPLINPEDLPAVGAMCQQNPGTRVVIDHFARIGITGSIDKQQLDTLVSLAKFPDVHVKTSAFYALGKKKAPYEDLIPMIRRLLDAFGPERLMWATDCPYQVQQGHTYADSISLIRDRIDFLSAGDKAQILRGTAERVFFH